MLMKLSRWLRPSTVAHAHCDLPCGVYDPAQARIEAESLMAIAQKYQDNADPDFRTRALIIKEQRAELVKHHLWVLWTDYFKAAHFQRYPNLHALFNEATKLAGGADGAKSSTDPGRRPAAARPDRRDLQGLLGDEAGGMTLSLR
jgi:nickel superoxide dismutase